MPVCRISQPHILCRLEAIDDGVTRQEEADNTHGDDGKREQEGRKREEREGGSKMPRLLARSTGCISAAIFTPPRIS